MDSKQLTKLKRFAYLVCFGMFFVVLNGAVVTKTGSGEGCGTDWPLCNGEFIPAYTIESMIEYSHRLVSGIEGLLVIAIFVWVIRQLKKKDAVFYASLTLIFTVIQALMGALAVMYVQVPAVMALHFGFSIIAFASSFLLSIAIRRYANNPEATEVVGGTPVNDTFRYGVWFTLLYTYIVIYVGAFVRHTDSGGGCLGWPLCNGELIPELTGGTLIAFLHRVAAALLVLVVAAMSHFAYHSHKDNREIQLCGIWALILTIMQVLSGALVVFTVTDKNWFLFTGLLHTVLICLLFSVLCHLSIRVWQLRTKRQ
ncbi:COX15/CtaA family protein [Paenibacillus agilis]|uniref:COX15/CtaA family protein n=1 Tax=Paenibacillus agilis TaxID=3020863 RepID=UPI0021BD2549|nr:COX15/CtaA family protein [Paenibacillus agilis]